MVRNNDSQPQRLHGDSLTCALRRIGHDPSSFPHDTDELPTATSDAMVALLSSCADVILAERALVSAILGPDDARQRAVESLRTARLARDDHADAVLLTTFSLDGLDLRRVTGWIAKIEADAIKRRDLTILDVLFEDGLKPAFERAIPSSRPTRSG